MQLDRRRFLCTTGALAMVAISGCLGDDSSDDPEAVVEDFYEALADGDVDAVGDLLHDDSPMELLDGERELEDTVITVEQIETVAKREDDDRVLVSATVTWETAEGDTTSTEYLELRTEDDAWRVWDEMTVVAPATSFDYTFDDGQLEILLVGGESIEAGNLDVTGSGIGDEGSWAELSEEYEADTTIYAGDSLTLEAESDFEIELVWLSPEWEVPEAISDASGPDA